MSDDIVYFLLPDGSKVSNDPRWLQENAARALEEALDATPNTGNVGIPDAEQRAQLGGGIAPGQSGQEGVGESPTATLQEMIAGQVTGGTIQTRDALIANELDATPESPYTTPPEPIDSNKAVLEAREAEAKRQEAAAKAAAALADAGEEPGDPNVPLEEWTGKQLKAEVLRRNAERPEDEQISTTGITKKAQLAEVLKADDDARSGNNA